MDDVQEAAIVREYAALGPRDRAVDLANRYGIGRSTLFAILKKYREAPSGETEKEENPLTTPDEEAQS